MKKSPFFPFQPCRDLFEKEGLTCDDLENDQYKAAYKKLQIEEAMLNLSEETIFNREYQITSYQRQTQQCDSDSDYD